MTDITLKKLTHLEQLHEDATGELAHMHPETQKQWLWAITGEFPSILAHIRSLTERAEKAEDELARLLQPIDGDAIDVISREIANIGYAVGMGLAPDPDTCRRIAAAIRARSRTQAKEG